MGAGGREAAHLTPSVDDMGRGVAEVPEVHAALTKEEMALAVTMGRYAGDGTMEAKSACVRAVRLPQ